MESADVENLIELLKRHISGVNARALMGRALRENGLSGPNVTRSDLAKCMSTLRRGVDLFVDQRARQAALREIVLFCDGDAAVAAPAAFLVTIETEADIGTARSAARRISGVVGASLFCRQKVATIVSELARNIVLYAQRGTVEIIPHGTTKIVVRALDQGPGIPNLEHVLSGKYQSKTGLGRGLLGTKQLADRFDISTGSAGTQIMVEVKL
jgi:serine/threonine-protein kinase RsbT